MASKIVYQAIDKIAATHTLNNFYDLIFATTVLNDDDEFEKATNVSLNGSEETMFIRTDKMWRVTAEYIQKTDLEFWKEFFYSVKIGESFTFYPDSTGPGYTCIMSSNGYKPGRIGTTDDEFNFNMLIKEEV